MIDGVCKEFGFPFRNIRSCRATDCKCMKFKKRAFSLRRKDAGDERLEDIESKCMECNHEEKEHRTVEKDSEGYYDLQIHVVIPMWGVL